jgi:hypothetical protein
VESLDCPRGRDTHGGDEDFGPVPDGHFDQLVELPVRVVVVCLAGGAADLGQGEVYAEGERRVCQVRLQFVDDLSAAIVLALTPHTQVLGGAGCVQYLL